MWLRSNGEGWVARCFCDEVFQVGNCNQKVDYRPLWVHWNNQGGLAAHLLYVLMERGGL